MKFKKLSSTGNKVVFADEESKWKIWTFGPDEENHWNISFNNKEVRDGFETFDEAVQGIEKIEAFEKAVKEME